MTGSERNATMTGRRWENGAVLEFLTVGAEVRAILSGSVKGGAPLSQLCGERNEVSHIISEIAPNDRICSSYPSQKNEKLAGPP